MPDKNEMQAKTKEFLSDIDEMEIDENGVPVLKYWCHAGVMNFPCSSLSLALSCAKRAIIEGEKKVYIVAVSDTSQSN